MLTTGCRGLYQPMQDAIYWMSDLASLEQAISSIWGLSGRITHLKEGGGGLGDVGGGLRIRILCK